MPALAAPAGNAQVRCRQHSLRGAAAAIGATVPAGRGPARDARPERRRADALAQAAALQAALVDLAGRGRRERGP
jgi:hypothetical protein